MEPNNNKALAWYFKYEEGLSKKDKFPYFPHPESDDFWNKYDDNKEKKQLKQAREIRKNVIYIFQSDVPILASWTEKEVNDLGDIKAVIIGERQQGFTGAWVTSFIILADDKVHVFLKTHSVMALGLGGLIVSSIYNKGKNYVHEQYEIEPFIKSLEHHPDASFPYNTFHYFMKKTYAQILPAAVENFLNECNKDLNGETPTNPVTDNFDKLTELKKLYENDLITEAEYNAKKAELLKNI
ncbi:MAG: SHOCT domain-containing protein [Bacilli bacterium]|nr:SHOCT domain-containing protein [Bacilli bacterium]